MSSSQVSGAAKSTISEETWNNKLKDVTISKADMNKLVMNFFMVEGYKEAAEKFKQESQTEVSQHDLEQMEPRMNIRNLVLGGNIDEAMNQLNTIDQNILQSNEDLKFNVKLQKCIEYIRSNKIDEAIIFAREELVPIIEQNSSKKNDYTERMEKAMSLLVFENTEESPYNSLASNQQRIKVSSQINHEMLLKGQAIDKDNKLPTLLKLMLWSQEKLANKFNFPQIKDVTTGSFKTEAATSITQPLLKPTVL